MGINSYITHRMFVAALSHEKDSPEKVAPQTGNNKPVTMFNGSNPWEAQLHALAKARDLARHWPVTRVTGI